VIYLKKCPECGSTLKVTKYGKPGSRKKDKKALHCEKCHSYYLDNKTWEKLEEEMDEAERTKLIRVSKDIWDEANKFVRKNKTEYPSLKYFTQKALREKIAREKSKSRS
jgi:hypothetical protein